ncbi:YicC/YloC family endoribonuclease [Pelagibacterium lentulum]|uniref:YicC family protein n=1 Tax=Pelagibacterium lentulum TaxID=2029865 RepID=A0A916VXU0_9HYPH|nr:YicC/YloC family endoribonuclease [Pelagibacterium lentulum]GGA50388.1 hypothetical protein GCM10011499_20390 [Pelagibacterium lentulum]
MSKPLASMTGFGRASGQAGETQILCEVKSVNGRGFDMRARLSPGFEPLESQLRQIVNSKITRGSVSVYLNVQRDMANTEIVVNERALDAILSMIDTLSDRLDGKKPSIENILALKGVLDTRESALSPDAEAALNKAVTDCVSVALDGLVASREIEGQRIGALLAQRLDEIEALTEQAENHPGRSREAILARLREQLTLLAEAGTTLNEDRLHQEAMLLATKADIREEIDRLHAHVRAARALLAAGGPIGRKLDFLSQELNREANTLCSKSNDVGLTAIGLDLKAVIDQLREQVQNLE